MKIKHENKTIQIPDVFMVGAAKSGTTSLYKHLKQHKNVFFPKDKKEPFYFSFAGQKPDFEDTDFVSKLVWTAEDYIKLYEKANSEQLLIDGSTSYLYQAEQSIRNIQDLYGKEASSLKIIIILRNPIDRAYSHYNYLVRNGFEDLPFDLATKESIIQLRKRKRWGFDYIAYGDYSQQVASFQKHFKHVKVCLFEDLKAPQILLNEIFTFLGLEPITIQKDLKANPSGIPKNRAIVNLLMNNKILKSGVNKVPAKIKEQLLLRRDKVMEKFLVRKRMASKDRLKLLDHYRPEIIALSKQIDRDLSHWLV